MARSSPLQLEHGTQGSGQMFTKPVSTGRPTNINAHSDTHTHAGAPSKIKKFHQEGHGFQDKVTDLPAST